MKRPHPQAKAWRSLWLLRSCFRCSRRTSMADAPCKASYFAKHCGYSARRSAEARWQALYVHTCCKCGSKLFFIVEELRIVPSIAFANGKSFNGCCSCSRQCNALISSSGKQPKWSLDYVLALFAQAFFLIMDCGQRCQQYHLLVLM